MNIPIHIFLLVLFVIPCWGRPKTDVIVMKNGDRFTCEIRRVDSGVLYAKFDYMEGTISLDWSKVARVESTQLFAVQTASGEVYTGSLRTPERAPDEPVKIDVVEPDENEVSLNQTQVMEVEQASESFWRNFRGSLSGGMIYSRGNNTVQQNIASQLAYRRPRWALEASYSSSLSASSGATTATRNQLSFDGIRMLRRRNWFASGIATFLQSSQQEIDRQTTVGGTIGKVLVNSNDARISISAGFAGQRTSYEANAPLTEQNLAAGLIAGSVRAFRFKKTTLDLTTSLLPVISQPGRVQFNLNATYAIQIITGLWWNFTFYGNWDNRPPTGLSGSDYGSSLGITYTFN